MGPLVRIYFMGMLVTCQGKGNLRGRCSYHCVPALAGEDKSSGWAWWQNFRRILWRSESDGTREEGPPSGSKNLAKKLRSGSKLTIVLFLTCHGSAQRATIRSDAHPVCKSGSPYCFWKLRYASPHNAPKDRRSCGFQKGKFLKFVYLFFCIVLLRHPSPQLQIWTWELKTKRKIRSPRVCSGTWELKSWTWDLEVDLA